MKLNWVIRKSGTPTATDLAMPQGQGSALGIDTGTGSGYYLKDDGSVAQLSGGSGAVLGPAWSVLAFSGSTSTQLGQAGCNAATATVAVADNNRFEIEAYVYKSIGNSATVGIGNGTDGYYMTAQGDGNCVLYRYKGGAATSLGGTGVNAIANFTGIYFLKMVIHSRPSTRQEAWGMVDEYRAAGGPFQDNNVGLNFSTTLTPFICTDDTTKCYARVRVLS